jgi:hypothetical protein
MQDRAMTDFAESPFHALWWIALVECASSLQGVSTQASVTLVSPGGRCSGGAAAIGIPWSCSPLDNGASSLAINARMRWHSFNTNANLSSSSSVMPSAPCPLCRRVGSKNSSSKPSSDE